MASSLSSGTPAGHHDELCLHHRRVYSRSSSYKQQAGREPCKGRKKAETHLPPHLSLVTKPVDQSSSRRPTQKLDHRQAANPPTACQPPSTRADLGKACGEHRSSADKTHARLPRIRILHHRTKYVGSAAGMHNDCIHDPAWLRFLNPRRSSSRSAHTKGCERLHSTNGPPDPPREIAQEEYFG